MKKITLLFLLISISIFSQKSLLKKEISKITEGKNATVAVSVLEIDFPFKYNNQNAEKKLPMQSVFKFHIALAVLDLVDQGKLKLDQKIFIKKSELLPNTWSPIREKFPEGNFEMPLSEILKYTVAQSDNVGCDVLLRLIGGTKTVQNFMNSKGVKDFQIKYNEEESHQFLYRQYDNYTSTKSLAKLMKNFHEGKIVSERSTKFLYNIMLHTSTCLDRLRNSLPKNATLANKTGTSFTKDGLTAATNDSGIVTLANGKKYVIVVFVSDSKENEETNEKIISDTSKKVFEYLSQSKN